MYRSASPTSEKLLSPLPLSHHLLQRLRHLQYGIPPQPFVPHDRVTVTLDTYLDQFSLRSILSRHITNSAELVFAHLPAIFHHSHHRSRLAESSFHTTALLVTTAAFHLPALVLGVTI